MRGSIKIGRWWGVDVHLHYSFLLLLAWVGLSGGVRIGSVTGGLSSILMYACLFGCVLLHEFGHAMAARHYGIETRDITLLPIGGVARLERLPDNPVHELVIAIAGPLVNVVLAFALGAFLFLGHQPLLPGSSWGVIGLAQQLLVVNVSLVAFNLLPAFPMDGGRILRAFLSMVIDPVKATKIAAFIGRVMAVLFAAFAIYTQAYMLLIIAVFVWLGAGGEARATEARAAAGGAFVADAMQTRFQTLSAQESLGDALHRTAGGDQSAFPVLEGGRLLGLLLPADLPGLVQQEGERAPVSRGARTDFVTVSADEPLGEARARVRASAFPAAPVLWQGRMVGLLDLADARGAAGR